MFNALKRVGVSLMDARQDKANYEIAKILQRTEYQNDTLDHILSRIRNGTLGRNI